MTAIKWNNDKATRRLYMAGSSPALCCFDCLTSCKSTMSCCSSNKCLSTTSTSSSISSLCTTGSSNYCCCCCCCSSNRFDDNKSNDDDDESASCCGCGCHQGDFIHNNDDCKARTHLQSNHYQHSMDCCSIRYLDKAKTSAPLFLDDARSRNATKRKITLNCRAHHHPSTAHSRRSSVAPLLLSQPAQTTTHSTPKSLDARNWATKHLLKFGEHDHSHRDNQRRYGVSYGNNDDDHRGSSPLLKGVVSVRLHRPVGVQLGLGIAGGADRGFPPTVSFLRPGFIAHRCDQLQIGERLTYVSGIPVSSLTHDQVLTVLRNAGTNVYLQVEYDLNSKYFKRAFCENTMSKCTDIVLEKERGSYGVTLRGGAYGPDRDKSRPITVTNIRAGGPAHREGRLQVGDRVLCINGVDVFSATLAVAQRLLEQSLTNATLTIEYDVSVSESVGKATGALLVEIGKSPGADLGLKLQIREVLDLEQYYRIESAQPCSNQHSSSPLSSHRAILIDSIIPASIADRCGALHCGDEIISVDGLAMDYTTLAEAKQLLRSASARCRLEIILHSQIAVNNTNETKKSAKIVDGKKKIKAISEAYSRKTTLNAAVGLEPHHYCSTVTMSTSPTVTRKHVVPQPRAKSHDRALLMAKSMSSSNDMTANICGGRYIMAPPAAVIKREQSYPKQQRQGHETIAMEEENLRDSQDVIFFRGYAHTRRRFVGEMNGMAKRNGDRRISGSVPNIRHDDDGDGAGATDGVQPGAGIGTSDISGSGMNDQFTSANLACSDGVQSVMSSSYSGDTCANDTSTNNYNNSNNANNNNKKRSNTMNTSKRRFSSIVSTSFRRRQREVEQIGEEVSKQSTHSTYVVNSLDDSNSNWNAINSSKTALTTCGNIGNSAQNNNNNHLITSSVPAQVVSPSTRNPSQRATAPGQVGPATVTTSSQDFKLRVPASGQVSGSGHHEHLQQQEQYGYYNRYQQHYQQYAQQNGHNNCSLHGQMSTVVPSASVSGFGCGYGFGSGYVSSSSPMTQQQHQQVCHRETMEVSLHSYAKGAFGLVLQRQQQPNHSRNTTASTPMPLFISYIEKGSSAERCGVLQVGDRVLTINEWYTANGTVEEANHIMRHSSSPLTLTVEFDVIESLLPPNGILNVKLAKRGNNLGIVTKSETDGRKGEPIIISDIRTGSVAQRCGSISIGDRILAIDNIPLESCTVGEAMRLLQRSGDVVKLRIRKAISQDENDSSHMVVYSIELNRKGRPMGITIASRGERGDPVIISQLAPRGLAERTGALRVGDRILAINGESIEGKKVSDAMHLLQQSGDIVAIKISRCIDHSCNHPYSNSCYPLSNSGPRHRMMGGMPQTTYSSIGQATVNGDSYNEPPDKLGTPIQSIDSAVESLEDSPVQHQQQSKTSQNSAAQHRFSADDCISNVQLQYLCEDERTEWSSLRDIGNCMVITNAAGNNNNTNNNNTNEIINNKNGWDSGMSSTTDNCMMMECCSCQNATTSNTATDDWVKILEALETVGEAEMLKKLEDSIMSGTVPPCSHLHSAGEASNSQLLNMRPHAHGHATTSCTSTSGTQTGGFISSSGGVGGLLSPSASILGRQQLQHQSFTPSNTNTILKHPPLASATSSTIAQIPSRPLMSGSIGSDRGDSLSVNSGDSLTGCSLSYEIPPSMPPPKPPRYEQQQQPPQASSAVVGGPGPDAGLGTGAGMGVGPSPSTASSGGIGGATDHRQLRLLQPILNPLSAPVGAGTISDGPLFTSSSYINSPTSSRSLLSNRSIKPSTSGLMLHELNSKTDFKSTPGVTSSSSTTANVNEKPKGTTHRVVLHKDPAIGSFGFSVSDGAGDNPGVFINAILPGGPADRSGQIQPLDRILQVNDTSLQYLDCDLAVPLLSVDRIELLLYRDGTLKRIQEIDEAMNTLNTFKNSMKDSAV